MNIRTLYLYLFSFVGLITVVFGGIQIIDLGLKVYVFNDADRYEYSFPEKLSPDGPMLTEEQRQQEEQKNKEIQDRELVRQRQRQLSTSLSMIAIGAPLYLYHWTTIARENKHKK